MKAFVPSAPRQRRLRPRRVRVLALASLFAALVPLAALAAPGPVQPGPPATSIESPAATGATATTFRIEEITVEGTAMLSATTIHLTSQLVEGNDYPESQLRSAMGRIVHLPLVLNAEFSLAKGSSRGLYRLIIQVEEVPRWIFGLHAEETWLANRVSVEGLSTTDRVDEATVYAGRRFPVSERTVAFGVVSGDGELTAGISRYELFGRGGLATFSISTVHCEDIRQQIVDAEGLGLPAQAEAPPVGTECRTQLLDPLDPTPSTWSAGQRTTRFRLDVGLPLTGNHSLHLRGEARQSDSGIRRPAFAPKVGDTFGFEDREDQILDLSWVHNSIDDPHFPTSGARLQAGVTVQRLRVHLRPIQSDPSEAVAPYEMQSTVYGFSLTGEFNRRLGRGHTLTLGGRAFVGERDAEEVPFSGMDLHSTRSTIWRVQPSLQHTMLLHRSRPEMRRRELRWTSGLELFEGSSYSEAKPSTNLQRGFEISSGLSVRTDWGVLSFRLAYLDRGTQ